MPQPLTDLEVTEALRALPGWTGDQLGLHRTVEAADFPTAVRIIDAVAVVAEELDHHPDIDLRWRRLFFHLSTHSVGAVTERDLDLARRIDAVVARHPLA